MKLNYLFVACAFLFDVSCNVVHADTWVDIDGDAYVKIDNGTLALYSTNSFYYFDELFTSSRKGTSIRLCIGQKIATQSGTDCLINAVPSAGFDNKGKNRSLHFDISQFSFTFTMLEEFLKNGGAVNLSIDDGDLLASYTLRADYKLNENALEILRLND